MPKRIASIFIRRDTRECAGCAFARSTTPHVKSHHTSVEDTVDGVHIKICCLRNAQCNHGDAGSWINSNAASIDWICASARPNHLAVCNKSLRPSSVHLKSQYFTSLPIQESPSPTRQGIHVDVGNQVMSISASPLNKRVPHLVVCEIFLSNRRQRSRFNTVESCFAREFLRTELFIPVLEFFQKSQCQTRMGVYINLSIKEITKKVGCSR